MNLEEGRTVRVSETVNKSHNWVADMDFSIGKTGVVVCILNKITK